MHYLYGNSDRCQPCIRCMEGVRNSEGPLWEVPLYNEILQIRVLNKTDEKDCKIDKKISTEKDSEVCNGKQGKMVWHTVSLVRSSFTRIVSSEIIIVYGKLVLF